MSLTEPADWDEYWARVLLPAEVTRRSSRSARAILETFHRHLDADRHGRYLEVGGAPGQYIVYLSRHFNCSICVLDNSPAGCEMTRQNLRLLGIAGRVVEQDLFDYRDDLGRFDAVYSLGLVEHFEDLTGVVRAHLRLVQPGGLLIVGCPNFRGVYTLPLLWLRPAMMVHNNRSAMKFSNWDRFEAALPVTRLFRGCIGGFEPGLLSQTERRSVPARATARAFGALDRLLRARPGALLGGLNSTLWSGYRIGVYRHDVEPRRASSGADDKISANAAP